MSQPNEIFGNDSPQGDQQLGAHERAAQQVFFVLQPQPHSLCPKSPHAFGAAQSSHGTPSSCTMIVSSPAATGGGSSATIKRLTRAVIG